MAIAEKIPTIEAETYSLIRESYGDEKIVPPIDLKKIAENNGITIGFVKFKNNEIDGAFKRKEKEIYINAYSPLSRQLFSIAHELGHFFMHQEKQQDVFFRSDAQVQLLNGTDKENEQEANWFAASLLMPKKIVLKYWEVYPEIERIADIFAVSYSIAGEKSRPFL